MAVVFRNGFFSLSLSLPSLMHPLPPLSLSLCLTLPRETRSVRRLAAGLKGSRYSVAESTPVCQFYPQEIRVFVPSSTPPRSFPALVLSSFSPAPLFMLPVNRENGHPSLFLHLLPLSLSFFSSFLPPPSASTRFFRARGATHVSRIINTHTREGEREGDR